MHGLDLAARCNNSKISEFKSREREKDNENKIA